MKNVILVFTVALLGFLHVEASDIPSNLVQGFKSGNASLIAGYFNSTIEMTIYNREEIYSKTQAERILKDFFQKNPPAEFTLLHQGGKESSRYAIGSLKASGKSYRITFLLKTVDSKVFIHQLRIEDTNAE